MQPKNGQKETCRGIGNFTKLPMLRLKKLPQFKLISSVWGAQKENRRNAPQVLVRHRACRLIPGRYRDLASDACVRVLINIMSCLHAAHVTFPVDRHIELTGNTSWCCPISPFPTMFAALEEDEIAVVNRTEPHWHWKLYGHLYGIRLR